VNFITAAVARASVTANYNAADFHMALRALASEMLARRNLDPRWSDIKSWFPSSGDTLPGLRALAEQGEIIRLATLGEDQGLTFRHDRVRGAILTSALAERLESDSLDASVLSDPFFADLFGNLLASARSIQTLLPDLTRANPLALFYGLTRATTGSSERASAIADAILAWLQSPEGQSNANTHLRWDAQRILSQIESPYVVGIIKQFRHQSWHGWGARLRNGDLAGGLELCRRLEPGTGDPWRDDLMDHVKLRFGNNLVTAVDEHLRKPDLSDDARLALIRIAGYLADPRLNDALAMSWANDSRRAVLLDEYLVSGAYCYDGEPAKLLAHVCDAWGALPNRQEKDTESAAREDVAAHGVRFAFRQRPPRAAIPYFIERARSEDLNWPIIYMLYEIDEPQSIEFLVHQLAAMARRLEGTGRYSPFLMRADDRWSRPESYSEEPMSAASKQRLLELWTAEASDKHVKVEAFRLWVAAQVEGDLDILRGIDRSDLLADRALFARLMRGDHSAIPWLQEKLLGEKESYWWQTGRYIWSDSLTNSLDQSLTRRGLRVERSWSQKHDSIDWVVSELLLRLPTNTTEALLIKHWDHLRYTPYFIHSALHTAAPSLTSRVQEAMRECPNPKQVMKHIHHHFGMNRKDFNLPRLAQIETLVPYFDLFDEFAIYRFWELCGEQGWLSFRKKHLDSRIDRSKYGVLLTEEDEFKSLDEFATKDQIYNTDIWFNRRRREGKTVNGILTTIHSWLFARNTFKAFEILAAAVRQFGERRHIALLAAETIEPKDAVASLVVDTAFAVKIRTLN
jgi:hypothetical protein